MFLQTKHKYYTNKLKPICKIININTLSPILWVYKAIKKVFL